jgi:hypothetical protein
MLTEFPRLPRPVRRRRGPRPASRARGAGHLPRAPAPPGMSPHHPRSRHRSRPRTTTTEPRHAHVTVLRGTAVGSSLLGARRAAAAGPKPVAITVILTFPLIAGSTTAPKMMLASSPAASWMIVDASLTSTSDRSGPPVTLMMTPRAPLTHTPSSSGLEIARRAASTARSSPCDDRDWGGADDQDPAAGPVLKKGLTA